MNMNELVIALRKLRLSGMADTLELRLLEAQTEKMVPIDIVSSLVSDELVRRQDRLLARRLKKARFRDQGKTLDGFDFTFNKKLNNKLVYEVATARFVSQCEDVLMLGPPGTAKSHRVQAIGTAAIALSLMERAHSPEDAEAQARALWESRPGTPLEIGDAA